MVLFIVAVFFCFSFKFFFVSEKIVCVMAGFVNIASLSWKVRKAMESLGMLHFRFLDFSSHG